MALEIPKVGLVMENARLVRWLKNVGDAVQQGEPLLELETEKSVVEIESTETGRLVEILLQADQEAHVGDRIAWLENGAAATTPANSAAPAPAPATARSTPTSDGAAAVQHATQPNQTGRIASSPVSRRLAAEHALDLRRITGTGPRGRVQLVDVQRAIESQPGPSAPAGLQPLSSMRRAVARSMALSNATVPQFTVERAVDWTSVLASRAEFRAALPADTPSPSVNDFLLQALARALLAFPTLNATFWGHPDSPDAGVVPANGAHIGLVVAVENGLLVPVLHDVEQFGLAELARRRSATAERALNGKLKREDLEGATLSLSNLGARGPDRFNALINPPQSAILAVGRQRDCVVARDGTIQVRPMSELALTVDHRVADGRLASDFLASVVDSVESGEWRLN